MGIADEIFLGKCDLWLSKVALSAVYRTMKVFPYLRNSMTYYGTLTGFNNYKEKYVNYWLHLR